MELSAETILRYSRQGPRYTSYPTAPQWREDYPAEGLAEGLAALQGPASVYVHIPFCREQCSFCGCNMVVAGRREPGTRYLDALERQIGELPLPAAQIDVLRIHLGGGTPTWLSVEELQRLYGLLRSRFRPAPGAELSVEADPEVTTDEQVEALAALGVNRLSMGVQSFDPVVLAAVNRPQRQHRVARIMELARQLGMYSLNLDLIYGLPHQSPASFADTIDRTLEMAPDRLAIFGYAHLPWLKPHMKKIEAAALPGPLDRVALFLLAHERLTARGYQAIGIDHFALPGDELAVAQRAGALHRNFMGYTTLPGLSLIGLGMSAISELPDRYVQQRAKLSHWWSAVEAGQSAVEKGCALSAEDQLRREAINALMCNLELRWSALEARHPDARERLAPGLLRLAPMIDEGLVMLSDEGVFIPPRGRLLVRNAAMAFDAYLDAPSGGPARPRYSQTV